MKNNLLSIITITKNDYPGFVKTLNSTKSLRGNGVSQIVIDSSNQVAATKNNKFASVQKNIFYDYYPQNGIAAAFNQGLTALQDQSTWVWFLNGGDQAIIHDTGHQLMSYLDSTSADIIIFEHQINAEIIKRPPFFALYPPAYNWIPHPSTIIRTSLFNKVGKFNEKYEVAMDGEFWMRALSRPDVQVDLVSIPLTKYDNTGISSTNTKGTSREVVKIILLYKWTILKHSCNSLYLTLRALLVHWKNS